MQKTDGSLNRLFFMCFISSFVRGVDHHQLIDRVTAVAARLDKRILAIVPQTEVVGRADLGVVRERQLTVFRNDRLK